MVVHTFLYFVHFSTFYTQKIFVLTFLQMNGTLEQCSGDISQTLLCYRLIACSFLMSNERDLQCNYALANLKNT